MKKEICRTIITPQKHTFRHLLWKIFRTFTLHETPASAFPAIPPQQFIVQTEPSTGNSICRCPDFLYLSSLKLKRTNYVSTGRIQKICIKT